VARGWIAAVVLGFVPICGAAWAADAGAPDSAAVVPCFRATPDWRTPEEFLLGGPVTVLGAFGLLVDASLEGRLTGAASGIRRWLGLDEVTLDRGEIRLRSDYGDRLTVRSTAGLGASAEDALQADYRLWRSWYLRSEARERGETFMEFRKEFRFW
jgi:hypothetical protein